MIDKLDINTKAQSLRKELGEDLESSIDIFSLAHTIPKLTIVYYPMGERISGLCIKNNGYPVIAINSAMSIGRQRFSLAHELYHLYYDNSVHSNVCAKKIGSGNDIEKSADQFASYFLMPIVALDAIIKRIKRDPVKKMEIKEIVKLEQYFGVSRQALLYRLVADRKLSLEEAEKFKEGVISSAVNLGYDDALYKPLPKNKQYRTFGYYIEKAEELYEKDIVSTGKYEHLLLTAFRPDLVYGEENEGGELND
ncbi:MAG: ImmA/IrrE family metallo-endopeptidase [Bacillota bacterium]|nr:ImmA/IrrE family metallo-endopeptidase [Bacillota bacterium]